MLTCQKDLFSLEDDFHYINCAYMSPLMRSVEEAGFAGVRKKARPYRLTIPDFFGDVEILRGLFAQLIQIGRAHV